MADIRLSNGRSLTVQAVLPDVFRVRFSDAESDRESMLTRYGILKTGDHPDAVWQESDSRPTLFYCGATVELDPSECRLTVANEKVKICLQFTQRLAKNGLDQGFAITLDLDETERLFGLGDETRTMVMKRGHKADLWQANVSCYGPIPYVMSSRGWGLLVNCTYRHTYDLGAEDPSRLLVDSPKGLLDFYVFLGGTLSSTLNLYTDIAGKPLLLPKAAYGLTFVCNEEEGARELLENCRDFRREGIPCDIMGLEPGWMETHYDFSVNKKWDPTRFYIPHWNPDNQSGPWTFFASLRRMGFQLSLWLCNDYDLLWEEEKEEQTRSTRDFSGAAINDAHLSQAIYMDTITKPGEPWFEHLKKFVDNGASAFKLDGANQTLEHPDRLWAGKYFDDEVHNVYPVLYGKQMKEGYAAYTGKRALIYSACMYAGTQRYCATWAGDTGGGYETLVSILNLGLSGHSNATCDMEANTVEGIHYGSLLPWTQLLGWRNWLHPWFLGDGLEEAFRYYTRLRSSLFWYLYSAAYEAAFTGMPMARALSLAYPDRPAYDSIMTEYMLGRSLLVGAFDSTITLPDGTWTDFWTGEECDGNTSFSYTPPENRGGALFVKAGAILPLQDWAPCLTGYRPKQLTLHLYPGDGEFPLYEDDGETYGYQQGEYAITSLRQSWMAEENELLFSIGKRAGSWPGMPEAFSFRIAVHTKTPPKWVLLDGEPVSCHYEDATHTAQFSVPAGAYADSGAVVRIGF